MIKLIEDLTSVDLEREKYQLYDCKSAVCERTSGYIKYGKGLSSIGRCPDNADCTVQAEEDNIGLERSLYISQGTLKYSGNNFTYTVEGGQPKIVTSGNDYLFVKDNRYYDYINFSNANIVAFIKNGKFIENKILFILNKKKKF